MRVYTGIQDVQGCKKQYQAKKIYSAYRFIANNNCHKDVFEWVQK